MGTATAHRAGWPRHNGTMAFWRALAKPLRWAALVAGALPVLAFPAPNLEFLAWFALVPGLLLMRAAPSGREAGVRGWWFGAGFIFAAHYWLLPNIGPALLLVAIVMGAVWIPVGVSTRVLLRPPVTAARALAALVVVPSYWLVIEWIRSWQGFGGPWALLGASQWQHPVVLALAAVGGVWLVSFAIVAANVGIVILLAAGHMPVRLLGAAATAVVQRHLGADSLHRWLAAHGWDVQRIASRAGYRVLRITRPGAPAAPADTAGPADTAAPVSPGATA